ncbi:hypothetical protein BDZ94DRAFT_324391 [Collybia nuda]|uniref:Uncharacterized protein n=1 Tax=Collybia nuda TaxID=64659 RepID=A0A9P5YBA2_9AGAR|nr:hypothetical protein BDZ94DRAFT_324391 [Collybia nuda]
MKPEPLKAYPVPDALSYISVILAASVSTVSLPASRPKTKRRQSLLIYMCSKLKIRLSGLTFGIALAQGNVFSIQAGWYQDSRTITIWPSHIPDPNPWSRGTYNLEPAGSLKCYAQSSSVEQNPVKMIRAWVY